MIGTERRRVAVVRPAEALRALQTAAVLTEVPIDQLESVTRSARGLAERLGEAVRTGPLSSVDDLAAGVRMHVPVTGEGSPLAPPMTWEGGVTLGPEHEGYVG